MPKKILIVEDSAADRKIIKHNLAKHGYENLIFATTGAQGITKAISEKPSLIILDINMPQMSGVEVHRILKNDPATKHIPIFFHTSLLKTGDIDDDMDKFIAKSPGSEALLEALGTIFGS